MVVMVTVRAYYETDPIFFGNIIQKNLPSSSWGKILNHIYL